MATAPATTSPSTTATPEQALADLAHVREMTLALVEPLSEDELSRVHSPLMSPLVWDLGHIAAYEDLWISHRIGGLELLRRDLADVYDAFETPRAVRGDIEALGVADSLSYMRDVRARTREVIAERGLGDGVVVEMVTRHELQHTETMRQTLALAGLLSASDCSEIGRPITSGERRAGGEHAAGQTGDWIDIAAGPFEMGAAGHDFSYDNERPSHMLELSAYAISRHPVTVAAWMRFAQDGGYDRRELWSDEGWAWRTEQASPVDPAVAAAEPQAPVCHVCWFEADAFARAHGARLPAEVEWEKAAKLGALEDVGRVWEWTATCFGGYPGFVAHPYREYSEVFFGDSYRVLRGGSWATHPRVGTLTFRNWDLPQRRQIFAGLRLAREAA